MLKRYGPARPGHPRQHVPQPVARTSRAMTARGSRRTEAVILGRRRSNGIDAVSICVHWRLKLLPSPVRRPALKDSRGGFLPSVRRLSPVSGAGPASGKIPCPSRLSPALLRAFRSTTYTTAGIAVRIGRRSRAADRLLVSHGQREAAFITAWNPLSRRMPAGWNQRMQSRLTRAVGRWPALPAGGGLRRWYEAHLLVFAAERRMTVLARRYRQHGIVVIRLGQPARLVLVAPRR